ncbi:RCC1 domain-containing protein [Deinococcus ficus]|uniref:RCC1-like domain-containing protein n=1 Tax=Deinococcus ficus TaxID=317577 RepID=A0A221T139_9DEIO|nr:hypothetical protein [Deinococcus ficus]ASN82586.1 hypothetical protein DFI_15535 [Deinococcus ficus]
MKRSLLIAALLLGACNSPSPITPDAAEIGSPGQGEAVVRLMLPHLKPLQGQYLNPTKTASLTVQVDNGPLTTLNLADLTCTSAGCPVNLYVSAGTHTFTVKSYSASSVLISQGTRSLNVILGQNNALELALDPVITSPVLRSAVQQVDPATKVIGNYTRFPYANGRSLVAYYDILAKDAVGDPIPSILCGDTWVTITNISDANYPNRYRVMLTFPGTHTLTAKTGSSCGTGSVIATQEVKTVSSAGIAGGDLHSLALMAGGTVRSWGDNRDGQLGDGTSNQRLIPVQVSGLTNVVGVSGGHSHSLALMVDGTVRAWGSNLIGQLGDGTSGTDRLTPVTVSGLTDVVGVAGGGSHSLALRADGTVRAWGNNGSGQLGDGTSNQRLVPVQVSGLTNVVGVAGGGGYSLALMADGTVRGWGANSIGQLGDGTSGTNRLTPVTVLGITTSSPAAIPSP